MTEQQTLGTDFQKPIERVEEYKFEPIKGYPMLHWKGKRPFESTQFYPAQLKEIHGEEVDNWFNRIYWGDNLQVMSHLLKEFRGKINLIYIDPPFDSKADYKKRIELRGKAISNDQSTFEEKQYTDIWTNDEYLQFMYERLILMRELLAENGSIYLHSDWHKGHYLRCIMEEIFGPGNFKNEIIWWYITTPAPINHFARQHDNILFYTKTAANDFDRDAVRVPYSQETLSKKASRRVFHQGDKSYQQVPHELGKVCPDVWEIPFINPFANERMDYPTQKPEKLLERIIKASSKKGDIIFDCFMGSGTTQAVAMKLGRRFIGADINLGAIQTTTKRLVSIQKVEDLSSSSPTLDFQFSEDNKGKFYNGFQIYNVNHYDFFRNELEAKDLLLKALEIQPVENNSLYDGEKDGRMVKIMPVNRIATRADLNELINNTDTKTFEKRQKENPNKPVEYLTLVCMGHEPDLSAHLQNEMKPYKIDVEVVDILRDKSKLELKRDAEAEIVRENGKVVIKQFYPMNLLQKLSLDKQNVQDWKELVESVMIDFNYMPDVLEPAYIDVPEGNNLVKGEYQIPEDAGTIRVKITDLLSESLEMTIK